MDELGLIKLGPPLEKKQEDFLSFNLPVGLGSWDESQYR